MTISVNRSTIIPGKPVCIFLISLPTVERAAQNFTPSEPPGMF